MPIEPIDRRVIIRPARRKHGIARLALFGSVLRDDFTPESDVDFLVEFMPDRVPGLIRLVRMERELGETIGRRANLRTAAELSKYFVQEVLGMAEPIYVAP